MRPSVPSSRCNCVGSGRAGAATARLALLKKSKAVSPPAAPAFATYFWCGKSRQNRSCREGARQTAPGPLRFSQRTAGSELAPFGRSDMRNRTSPFAAAILGAIEADGWPPNRGCMLERWALNVSCPHPALATAEPGPSAVTPISTSDTKPGHASRPTRIGTWSVPKKSSKTNPDTKPPPPIRLVAKHLPPVKALLPTFQAIVKSRSPASA